MTSLFFGSFELDTDRRLLLSGGQEIHISRKGFELLRVLLDRAPKALSKQELHDLIWERIYEPIAGAVGFSADRLNRLQFLTIRRYLSLVFGTLVTLLLVLAIWS